ncbi:signal recognition particle 14kD protein [Cryomyces antarcticus]|nr:hypothetical protein LTR04_000341 [Oleoguttula sp. CCFEE 6159]
MAGGHLSNEEFFTQLSSLFDTRSKKEHGSIYLTQKRLTYDLTSALSTLTKSPDDPLWDLHPSNPLPILIRATDGKSKDKKKEKAKLSTVVRPDELEGFYARYAECCRAGMQALKKRDRSKRKKVKKEKRKAGVVDGEKKA